MGSKYSILYIEYDAEYINITENILQSIGCNIDFASNFSDGLKRHKSTPYDLIILNSTLQDSPILDAINQFLQTNPTLPILLVMDDNNAKVVAEAYKAGVQNSLQKYPTNDFLEIFPTIIHKLLNEFKYRLKTRLKLESLESKNAQLSYAVRMAKVGIWEWDEIKNRPTYCSPELLNITDKTEEEFFTDNISHFDKASHVLKKDQESYIEVANSRFETNEGYSIEYRKSMANTDIRYFLERCEIELDEKGKLVRSYGITQDITELKETESAKITYETQLDAIINNVAVGIITISKYGIIESFNSAAQDIFGYLENDIIGCSVSDLIHPESRDKHEGYLADTSESARVIMNNTRGLNGFRKDQTEFPMDITISPMDLNGEDKFIAIVRDVTQRVLDQEKLYESQRNYQWAAVIGKTGHYIWDEVNNVGIYCSDELAKMFNITPEKYIEISKNPNQKTICIHPDDREWLANYMKAIDEEGDDIDIDYRYLFQDDRVMYVHKYGQRVKDDNGQVIKTLGIIHDITEEKIAQLALVDAMEEAQVANRSKSEFLAHMSHELRTPLNAITGFSQVMMGEMFGELGHPKYREYAADVQKSGQHLLSVINDILDLSKVAAGEFIMNSSTFNIKHVIDECVQMIRNKKSNDTVKAGINLEIYPINIYGDKRIMKQIILNLLSNAVKFTPPEGQIIVSTEKDAHQNAIVKIIDNGEGIADIDMQKVLEPFGQSKINAHHSHAGTGLGLSLSKKLIELHDGKLDLKSKVGMGTTVTLTIPSNRIS